MGTARGVGRALLALMICFLFALAGFYLHVSARCNLHTVEIGQVYRSAQMPAAELERFIKQAGIRSIVNLRGEHVGEGWYDDEHRTARALGVALINYPISARSVLSAEQMREISVLMRDAVKPMLIHCGGGADRTGLACAVYCVDAGKPANAAQEQMAPFFGHFPYLLWADAAAMDVSLDRYLRMSRVPLAGEAR